MDNKLLCICKSCNSVSKMKLKAYEKRNGRLCIECFNSILRPFYCESCHIEYESTHNEFNKYNKALCVECKFFL
jgi:hypothetical protein